MKNFRSISTLTCCALALACGDTPVASRFLATAEMGPAGGVLRVDSGNSDLIGAELVVPAGAITQPTTLTVEPGTSIPMDVGDMAAGPAARFGPSGLSFSVPATLTLPLTRRPARDEEVRVYAVDSDQTRRVLETGVVVTGDRVQVPVAHFTTFQPGIGAASASPDAGVADMGGSPDVGSADAQGPLDLGPPDLGPPDATPADLGPADSGSFDAGVPDTGPMDLGAPDTGVTPTLAIVTATVSSADACAATMQRIVANRSGPLQWRLLTFTELFALDPRTPPIGNATIDTASGEVTLASELSTTGVIRAFGVEVTDPSDGTTARKAWSYLVNGVNAYEVAAGGPPIFTGSTTLPNLSQASPSTYRPVVASSTHPCSVIYSYAQSCSPGTTASPYLQIFPPTGELTVVTAIDFFSTGPYCLTAHAEVRVSGQPVRLDSRTLTFTLVP